MQQSLQEYVNIAELLDNFWQRPVSLTRAIDDVAVDSISAFLASDVAAGIWHKENGL